MTSSPPGWPKRLRQAARKTGRSLWQLLPILVGVLLLASMLVEWIPQLIHQGILGTGDVLDSLLANLLGSISTGQPIVSYLLAGELQKAGIGLLPVTIFIVSWITVGVITLPAEAAALGWRFALWRNLVAFLLVFAIGILTLELLRAF